MCIEGIGKFQQGMMQKDLHRMNAGFRKGQAIHAKAIGDVEAGRVRQAGRRIGGAQLAAFGASAASVSTGSAASIQAETAYQTELDARTTLHNARLQAWGFKVQEASENFQAKMARRKAYFDLLASMQKSASAFGGAPGGGG